MGSGADHCLCQLGAWSWAQRRQTAVYGLPHDFGYVSHATGGGDCMRQWLSVLPAEGSPYTQSIGERSRVTVFQSNMGMVNEGAVAAQAATQRPPPWDTPGRIGSTQLCEQRLIQSTPRSGID